MTDYWVTPDSLDQNLITLSFFSLNKQNVLQLYENYNKLILFL